MNEKFIPKINLQTAISILEQNELISKNHFEDKKKYLFQEKTPCLVFFHSHEVESFLKNPSQDRFIYFARTGKTFDGHALAQKILNANQLFVGDEKKHIEHPCFIPVKNTEYALNFILQSAYNIYANDFLSIGITGTNGKTSTTQITAQILEYLFFSEIVKIGTLGIQIGNETLSGSHVTTPDFPTFLYALQNAKIKNLNKLVVEVTSHGLKEKRLSDWKFDVGVFTNLTQDHLDYHITMNDYRISKQKLFSEHLKENAAVVINLSTQDGMDFIKIASGKKRTLFLVDKHHSIKKEALLHKDEFQSVFFLNLENEKSDLSGLSGNFVLRKIDGSIIQKTPFLCPLVGHFQFENLLCSVAAALAVGFSLQKIASILTRVENIRGRLELITDKTILAAPKVLVDYAHTPDALEKAILACKSSLCATGKLTTVFGCGGDRDPSKRALMGKIASQLSHRVVVTSDNPRTEIPEKIIDDIFSGIEKTDAIFRETDRAKAIKYAILTSSEHDLVLVAGKGHEDYQVIGKTKHPFSDAAIVKKILLENYLKRKV